MNNTHINCKNFLAIDVFKGICKLDKKDILADGSSCEEFSQVEKCHFCQKYTPGSNGLGKCKETIDAYADMLAKTCEEFSWKTKVN
jgi:4-hydroxyphenylacetate decarboxylase small subunit